MKRFRLALVLFGSLLLATGAFAQTGILRTERAPTSVVTFTESADFLGLSSTHFIDGYVKRDGVGRFIFPVGHGSKAGPFATDGGGIIGAYFAESASGSVVSGGPFSVNTKTDEVQAVSTNEYWHIDGALATTLTFTWNNESAVAALTGSTLQKLSIVGWNATNKRWEKIPSQVDAVSALGGNSTLNAGSISSSRPFVPNGYEVFTLGALTNSVAPSDYAGKLEVADCRSISGWVYDKNNIESELVVEVVEGATVRTQTLANTFRSDLWNQEIGTGKYGFSIPLPEDFRDGNYRNLSVRVRGTEFVLDGSPRSVGCGYRGEFETADCYTIKGWTMIGEYPDSSLVVDLLADGQMQGSFPANLFRADIQSQIGGSGKIGFEFALPNSVKTNVPKQISLRAKDSKYVLDGSPKTLQCGTPQLFGNFESADCATFRGWVWDKTYPSSALAVEILEGGNVVASGVANIYRADLKAGGYGTGNYGFAIPLPASFKDGKAHQLTARVQGSSYMLGGSKSVTCLQEEYVGSFEEGDCNSLRGWVWDKNHPDVALTVELLSGGIVVGTSVAKTYRADLKAAGYGTGNYGFAIPLPTNLKDGQSRSYSIRVQGTTYVLGGSPRSITCAVPSQYLGSFELADCSVFRGWVWDKTYPSSALAVEILEGGNVVASGVANIYRADLKAGGYGTGNYGFAIPLPASFKDGKAHQLTARVQGSSYMLGGSKSVTCLQEEYVGSFEEGDCNSLRGWVWDKNHPDVALTVELLSGGIVVGTSVAKTYRADLKAAGYGTGNYGFAIPLPTNLKDGQSHSYSIRVQGTTYVLGGSPRSITCAVPSQYLGSFDMADCTGLKGWVWDKTYPASALTVEILEGGTVVGSGLANIYRGDLKAAGYGTGNYAFNIPLPASLKDGVVHQLSTRVKGSSFTLGGSPKSLGVCSTSARITELHAAGIEIQSVEEGEPAFTFFPNPTSGIVTARLDQVKAGTKLSVVNLVGRTVWTTQLSERDYPIHQQIDLREFSPGIYVVKLEAGSKIKLRRLVLVK
ncbi:MAG: T9SS type A sorting domain-containing protein [Dyadobacter sp.]|uniref:T9SS type A sorting domain-containing protein n=1 Tax=Dyadobacter sp. TaxID=1914288 RepID=UPI001B154854|nr:T9SS type A sorting domain-containing protein [Dyadobacter sp.]MBO9616402.1 T9SS type A sorting domain-containing protein [Dyadobacter sp.]